MTNNKPSYKWAKFKNGIGSAAIVTLDVYPNGNNQNEIIEHYNGAGFIMQGYLEEIPSKGYESWKIAARNGLEYAFSLVDGFWTVNLLKIEGRSYIDTNPTIAGYTVLRAFFDKINFVPEPNQIETLEEFVLSSWTKPYKDFVPNFFSLTFKEYGYDEFQ